MAKTVLGVDYGDARTGLALNAGTFAFGAGCVRCEGMRKTAEAVAAAAKEKKAELKSFSELGVQRFFNQAKERQEEEELELLRQLEELEDFS